MFERFCSAPGAAGGVRIPEARDGKRKNLTQRRANKAAPTFRCNVMPSAWPRPASPRAFDRSVVSRPENRQKTAPCRPVLSKLPDSHSRRKARRKAKIEGRRTNDAPPHSWPLASPCRPGVLGGAGPARRRSPSAAPRARPRRRHRRVAFGMREQEVLLKV